MNHVDGDNFNSSQLTYCAPCGLFRCHSMCLAHRQAIKHHTSVADTLERFAALRRPKGDDRGDGDDDGGGDQDDEDTVASLSSHILEYLQQ